MTNTDLIIRDARENERDAIRELTLAAYQQYEQVLPAPLWAGYRHNMIETVENSQAGEQIVAEHSGRLVGSVIFYPLTAQAYGSGEPEMPWPMVRLLAVLPEMRGHRIGETLMLECERRARQSGATALGLHTNEMMQAAMHLYQRLGFVRVPEYDLHPAPGMVIKAFMRSLD